jgi:hypothetical protein
MGGIYKIMNSSSSIVGHGRQREQLLQDIERGNVAHAYLFSGGRHLGKFTTARWFVQMLLMRDQDAQEQKQTGRLIMRNIHPDLLRLDQLWIEGVCTDWNVIAESSNIPQGHRAKVKVKTNTIGIDDIRALQERLHETSQSGKTFCLIRSIERLHITAANALLKILEEPPSHVIFCFTTESLSSLPPTIVSRMRVLHFSPLTKTELRPLMDDLPEEDRSLLIGIAQGAPGVILQCLENPEKLRAYRLVHGSAMRFLESPSLGERFQELQQALSSEADAESFLRLVLLHIQQKLRSPEPSECAAALSSLHALLPLLRSLQSNTHRSLLAARTVLCSSSTLP